MSDLFSSLYIRVLCSCGLIDVWRGFLKLLPEIGDGEDDDSEEFEVGRAYEAMRWVGLTRL